MEQIVNSFQNLSGAAFMYLEISFDYLNKALDNESMDQLVFKDLDYSLEDDDLEREIRELISNPIKYMRAWYRSSVSNVTFDEIKKRRAKAILNLNTTKPTFLNNYLITDLQALVHVSNLALFVETITNRHLFFLRETKKIKGWEYAQLEKSSVINKLIYLNKEENVHLNHVSRLFTLRNKAVHYTATNSITNRITIEILKSIWIQIITILKYFESVEQFSEEPHSEMLETYMEEFTEMWQAKEMIRGNS